VLMKKTLKNTVGRVGVGVAISAADKAENRP
jgi:hypothetical protein